MKNSSPSLTDIAVIGMAGRFPKAGNLEAFWRNLRDGVESITFYSDEELEAEGIEPAVLNEPGYVKAGYPLEEIDLFDAAFFGVTPRDAALLDPQHRLLLECAHELLEDAGYDPDTYKGLIGVYAGTGAATYLYNNIHSNPELVRELSYHHLLLTNEVDHLTTRLSYKLNLRGPSMAVQTTCSTSLVAISLACQQLLSYQCDVALAGGVSLLPIKTGYLHEGGLLSNDGHVRTFDAEAQGMAPGAGCGMVALKRLSDALADGDHVRAVIKGSAVNNDGSNKVGYTAPSIQGQAEVIVAALALAGVPPESVGYVEAHGTATAIGDPIEVAALTQAFRAATDKKGFCALGSVKSNIGHADAAAGVASFIKTVLALEHGEIPPSLHFRQPNPRIDFANSPFYVNATRREWKRNGTPRRAGVSSFGLGGTNAHVVLEEAPAREAAPAPDGWQLLTLSAKTEEAAAAAAARLAAHLKEHPEQSLADIAYTLHVGRKQFKHRRALVCRDAADARAALEAGDAARLRAGVAEKSDPPVVFMFPGQGSQYVGMGAGLYESEPRFREQVKTCSEILRPVLGVDLGEVLYGAGASEPESVTRWLGVPAVGLSACFVTEYALAKLLMSWGVEPQALIGHSVGEYVAACLAGVFSLEDALRLVALRGNLFQKLDEGAMLTVALSEAEVLPLLGDELSLAAVNAPASCLVSGPPAALEDLKRRLKAERVGFRSLTASRAGHSSMVEPILEEFRGFVAGLKLREPRMPYVSNVTGTWITPAEATSPDYYCKHLRQTVRFSEGVTEVLRDKSRLLLEVGPGRTLVAFAKKHAEKADRRVALPSMREAGDEQQDQAFLLNTLGQLWLAGAGVDWQKFHAPARRLRVPLPTYPFQRQRHWIEPGHKRAGEAKQVHAAVNGDSAESSPNPSAGLRNPSGGFRTQTWKRALPVAASAPGTERAWLVFADEAGLGRRLVERLKNEGRRVFEVRAGDGFAREADTYTINPRLRRDYLTLLQSVAEAAGAPGTILHLWNVDAREGTGGRFAELDLGFNSLLQLAQSLRRCNLLDPLRLCVVSTGLYEVCGGESLSPEKATLLGACAAVAQQHANINCQQIDLAAHQLDAGDGLLEQLLSEAQAATPEPTVAYRSGYRWLPVQEPVAASADEAALKERGVYLVTEGLDDPGFDFARHLAEQARARLLLVGSSELPPEDDPLWTSSSEGQGEPAAAASADTRRHAFPVEMEEKRELISELEESIAREVVVEQYEPQFERAADALCTSYICEYLLTNNLHIETGRRYGRAELFARLKVLPKFDKFFDFFLRVLAEDGVISRDGDDIVFLKHPSEVESSAPIREWLRREYPEFKKEFNFLDHCAERYREALTGEVEAISVIYPDGTPDVYLTLVENWRRFSNAGIYLELIPRLLAQLAAESAEAGARPLKVLEVGGGGGILSWGVAERLRGTGAQFDFTDLGKAFVINAERKAFQEELDFMKFGVLDISKEPAAQGYEPYSYDVILAFNVVHATKNIRETTENLKRLLRPNGVIVMLEVVRSRRSYTMVEGLTDGWWYYEDEELRRGTPLLRPAQWRGLMDELGFKSVRLYPQPEAEQETAHHVMIVLQQQAELDDAEFVARSEEEARGREALMRERVRRVTSLAEAGAEVKVYTADVADEGQMRSVLAQAEEEFGPLDGVVYVAGAGEGNAASHGAGRAEAQLRRAAGGASVVERLLRGRKLGVRMLVSAPQASADEQARAADAAVRAFLDATATARKESGWTSVGWELPPGPEAPGQFGQLLRRAGTLPQLVVSPGAGASRAEPWGATAAARRPEESGGEAGGNGTRPEADGQGAYVAPVSDVERAVARIWSEVFGIAQISVGDNFFDLGGESLLATQIVSRLRSKFEVELPIRSFYDNPTVAGLAAVVAAEKGRSEAQEPAIVPVSRAAFRARRPAEGVPGN